MSTANPPTIQPVRYHGRDRSETALVVRRGRRWLTLVVIDYPVRVIRVPRAHERHMVPLYVRGKPYPVSRAVRRFRAAAGTLGATRTARRYLGCAARAE